MGSFTHVDEATITLSVELVVRSHVHAVVAAERTLASPNIVIHNDDGCRFIDALSREITHSVLSCPNSSLADTKPSMPAGFCSLYPLL